MARWPGGEAVARRVGVDPRALAALRVGLALCLLLDLALRARWLAAFYTDHGVLPRAALRELYPTLSAVSLHAVSGAAWAQAALFLAAGGCALALLAGYRTRTAAVLSWLLLVSLHARNPLVLNAGDSLLRRALFWGLFLPLGARWALDADGRAERVVSPASAALLGQVVLVYAVNAALKLRSPAWREGQAVRYVFGLDQFTVWAGDLLAGHAAPLVAANYAWLALVCASPLLLLLTGWRRAALAGAFGVAHVGMALTMRLGLFPLVSLVALVPFLPPVAWDAAERRWRTLDGPELGRRLAGASAPRGPTRPDLRSATRPLVAALFALVLVWNAAALGWVALPATPVGEPSEHSWDMFAPPTRVDGWYVVPATTAAGERVDALHGGALDWTPPPDVTDAAPTARWRKYLDALRHEDAAARPWLAAYLCDRWARRHAGTLRALELVYVERPVVLDGPDPTRRVGLGRYDCSRR